MNFVGNDGESETVKEFLNFCVHANGRGYLPLTGGIALTTVHARTNVPHCDATGTGLHKELLRINCM